MKKIFIGLFLACLILSLFISCGKRENPIRTRYLYHNPWQLEMEFTQLKGNIIGDPTERSVYVYLPPMYKPGFHNPELMNSGFSVLYLLHDLGGDYSTFVSIYKIVQIADQLIDEGEIQPMIIVMPDASSVYMAPDTFKKKKSGTFYANSLLLGQYEDYIVHELMEIIDTTFHTYVTKPGDEFIPDPRYRAIGGLGMGGYGALKIAMAYDTLFSSVSAMSPFASLSSFMSRETIDKVFEENGIPPDSFSLALYKSLNPWEDSLHKDKTYSQLVFVMAAAFSPHDPSDTSTSYFFPLKENLGIKYGVDLPFDSTRNIMLNSPIWTKWLNHDPKTILDIDHEALGDLSVYLDCGDENEFGLYDGARELSQLLSIWGKEHTYMEYSGYPQYPSGQDNFTYDRLVEVLKFHSQHFPPPAYRKE